VLLSTVDPDPRPLVANGDAEVFVTVVFASGDEEELSGPSTHPSGSTASPPCGST